MTARPDIAGLCLGRKRLRLAAIVLAFVCQPASADTWYEHYFSAEQALDREDWRLAVEEINGALEEKGDPGARVRSYGMNVVAYFPYLKLGIAYYHLDQFDAALRAFETEVQLGAIAQSDAASAELERYRQLAQDALERARSAEQERIRRIVAGSLGRARELQSQGLFDEAIAELDQALAVAPDDAEATAAMAELRPRFIERQRELALDQQIARLIEAGRQSLDNRQYSEAASLFQQALFLRPSPAVQALLEDVQARLAAELDTAPGRENGPASFGATLDEVRALESAGRLLEALDRLQAVLVAAPSHAEALSIQHRLLQAQREAEAERSRRASIDELMAEAESLIEAGAAEASLAAANRVLALEPGNAKALAHVARAYGAISRNLLGKGPRGNIPPAVRFVDLRSASEDGRLVQAITVPDFQLTGVIIDESPVGVVFYGAGDKQLEARLNSQPLGEFYLTEFSVESRLSPGLSTVRLVATDSENLVSSSEYAVMYTRPLLRAPWFYAAVLGIGLLVVAGLLWRRARRLGRLRQRRFNPYVAGAPILDDEMFFGRRALVDRILQTVHNNSLLIYGERRIGKTSIQHQVRKRLRELDDPVYEFHPVYVDLQGTPETRFFRAITEEIFQQLAPVLDGLAPGKDLAGEYSYRDFVRDLHAVLKILRSRTSKRVKVVLLIDEVDELNDYDPRINQKLRSLFMKTFAENLAAVVSGVEIKKRWERQGSPWYNFFEEVEVAPLQPEEAHELISRPIRGVFKLERGAAEKIVSITGGKPYLIQKVCISLVTRLHEQGRRRITVADVEAVGVPQSASAV